MDPDSDYGAHVDVLTCIVAVLVRAVERTSPSAKDEIMADLKILLSSFYDRGASDEMISTLKSIIDGLYPTKWLVDKPDPRDFLRVIDGGKSPGE